MAVKQEKAKKGQAPKELVHFKDVNIGGLVNKQKAERAFNAVFRAPKAGSAEGNLLTRGRAEGHKGEDLMRFVYEGLGGLVSEAKAKKNRANEEKRAKARQNKGKARVYVRK